MNEIKLFVATPDDAEALLSIYAPYVKNTVISFEYEVPTVEEFRKRITDVLSKYPYIKATVDGETVGYCYASTFKPREAYKYSVEASIYVKEGFTGKGIGKVLYGALISLLKAQNVLNVNVCIGYPDRNDEYLTANSAEFHEHLGFTLVGKFTKCGYKFGKWYNMIWMEKLIGEHNENPKPFIPFNSLTDDDLEKANITK